MTRPVIRIGSRGSRLALWQAEWVKSELERIHPDHEVLISTIKTSGDRILDVPLAKVGGKGLFVKEIEQALMEEGIDLAVHSMKDMPGDIPEALTIGAVPEREVPHDVLIARDAIPLAELPKAARIGTSSLRRACQVLHLRPDMKILPIRGNLETRLKKLETEGLDAIILAGAGVKRLGLSHVVTETVDPELILPAVGQGALCIEIRKDDSGTRRLIEPLDHLLTRRTVTAERAFLRRLEGGCQVPMAAFGQISADTLTIKGMVAETDGSVMHMETFSGPAEEGEAIGDRLALALIEKGADRIIERLIQEGY